MIGAKLLQAAVGLLKGYFKTLSIGVQWEIVRLISLCKLDIESLDVSKLLQLRGSNAESAPKVVQVLLPDSVKSLEDRELVEKAFAQENVTKVVLMHIHLCRYSPKEIS